MSDDKDITLPSYERAATINPESYGHWDRAQISDLLHERDALRANVRCMVLWLEANQPDVFRRGLWDALAAKEKP